MQVRRARGLRERDAHAVEEIEDAGLLLLDAFARRVELLDPLLEPPVDDEKNHTARDEQQEENAGRHAVLPQFLPTNQRSGCGAELREALETVCRARLSPEP